MAAEIGDLVIDSLTNEIKVMVCGGIVGIGDYVKTTFAPGNVYRIIGIKMVIDLPITMILDYDGLELTAFVLSKTG